MHHFRRTFTNSIRDKADSRQRRTIRLRLARETSDTAQWQAAKSEFTRVSILEAVIENLADSGFAPLTLSKIARLAGLSKGAMQHHFEGKSRLIEAALHYIADTYINLIQDLDTLPSGSLSETRHQYIDALWDFINSPYYAAFVEIAIATKSEPIIAEAARSFYRHLQRDFNSMFGDILSSQNGNASAAALCSSPLLALDGLAMCSMLGLTDENEKEALLLQLHDVVSRIESRRA